MPHSLGTQAGLAELELQQRVCLLHPLAWGQALQMLVRRHIAETCLVYPKAKEAQELHLR